MRTGSVESSRVFVGRGLSGRAASVVPSASATLDSLDPPPFSTARPKLQVGLPSEEVEKVKWHCCCGCLQVRTAAIVIAIVEILILCQLLIFSFTNYQAGRPRYEEQKPIFAAVVKYWYLLPFSIAQIFWIASNFLLLLGLKLPSAPLLLPHLSLKLLTFFSGTTFDIVCLINTHSAEEISTALILFITLFSTLLLVEIALTWTIWRAYNFIKALALCIHAQRLCLAFAHNAADDATRKHLVWKSLNSTQPSSKPSPKPPTDLINTPHSAILNF